MSNRRTALTLAIVALLASTLLMEISLVSAKKKKYVKALAAAAMVARYLKPKKGILPIPLPLPVPLPIEWEQPPVVVHPKQHHVALPEPMPYPSHYGDHYGGYH